MEPLQNRFTEAEAFYMDQYCSGSFFISLSLAAWQVKKALENLTAIGSQGGRGGGEGGEILEI